MRTALLPASGDPFLIAYWLRHFRTWADKVDELRLAVCDQPDPDIRAYIRSLTAGLPVVLTFHPRTDHGAMIGWLLSETPGGLVMLCEDDAYVRRPDAVDNAFRVIEDNAADLVACPRGSATPELVTVANNRYGSQVTESGEEGPIYWPCFLFARRSDLLRTNGRFGAQRWEEAEAAMGVRFTQEQAADTFGWASLQLREMGLRVTLRAQYRAQRDLMADWGAAPWFHVGGLSAGYRAYLTTGDIAYADKVAHAASVQNDAHDWEKRVSWWQRITRRWDGALPRQHAEYVAAIEEWIDLTLMDRSNIDRWTAGFDHMVTWAE